MIQPDGEKGKPASWILVLAFLLGFPLLFAVLLRGWLGVPNEELAPEEAFTEIRLNPVSLQEYHSLYYGNLLFVRFRVDPEELAQLVSQMDDWESVEGPADKPITLELERPWWDPPKNENGVLRREGAVSVWNSLRQPDLFYAVAERPGAGDTESSAKSRE